MNIGQSNGAFLAGLLSRDHFPVIYTPSRALLQPGPHTALPGMGASMGSGTVVKDASRHMVNRQYTIAPVYPSESTKPLFTTSTTMGYCAVSVRNNASLIVKQSASVNTWGMDDMLKNEAYQETYNYCWAFPIGSNGIYGDNHIATAAISPLLTKPDFVDASGSSRHIYIGSEMTRVEAYVCLSFFSGESSLAAAYSFQSDALIHIIERIYIPIMKSDGTYEYIRLYRAKSCIYDFNEYSKGQVVLYTGLADGSYTGGTLVGPPIVLMNTSANCIGDTLNDAMKIRVETTLLLKGR